ncbi:binding-protein-dependent transport systems inner membrane component [Ruminiclostridium papyrosolvens DSM 2782]|uniref:Binding-protein-dependent transport systems inner membrane component n=1 Tax=Ruminiclostridium papyrosolvens DSM 2782 TaxID=588581 RepID=F1T8R9_9FIRM|nr:carbohydrate ABC transporter permease [Ruminiclostridium papyrosolvens]EGD48901.1 binding-protein-dependent transport systems inner membrane component [Ruminiclostridium papyrosolvens DSM 2782]WES35385.1 carbohydrate ABC transporter permease [Ruminiclostridium papyrosolvens DSM 2782]
MKRRKLKKVSAFTVVNNCFLVLAALLCIIPLIHILAVSFSSSSAAAAGKVVFWPVEFSLNSYAYVAKRAAFWHSMLISVERIALGGFVNLVLTILCAYPLSKEKTEFRFRSFYAWAFFITMLFNGGLIPWYIVIKQMNLLDSIWALVLPGAVPVFSVILLLNFFREIPKELNEAAFIDGASHWTTLWRVVVPVSTPALATITLFSLVGHWNSWFDGLILMNKADNYPLQSYIQTIVVQRSYSMLSRQEISELATISDRTLRASQIFLGTLPIVLVYPFLQKYFVKGIVLGGVKG